MKPDVLIGHVIDGRYRLDARIGLGGMGSVYRATRLLIGDEVAVKILHPDNTADQHAAERFKREAQTAARLKHPNAVQIYDFGISSDGLQYLVMELVEGESLRKIMKQQGPLTPSMATEVVSQVCAALEEAHRHNIVHRDVKPDNIIVKAVSATGVRVKVLDFGIAKLRDPVATNLTQTGSVVGTPHYMSPEQCLGEEVDNRADIYSLGIVLYEMLCGVVPFNSPNSTAVVVQHVNQPPPPLRSKNPSIPASVEAVVLHALEKRREARPQTAEALARELRHAVYGSQLAAPHAQTDEVTILRSPGAFFASNRVSERHGRIDVPVLNSSASDQPNIARKSNFLILAVVALALTLIAGGVALYLWFSNGTIEEKLNAAMTRGDLFKPEGASAYDLYNKLKQDGADENTLARFKDKLLPMLTTQPLKMLAEFAVPADKDPSLTEWQDALKRMAWASEMKPGDSALAARAKYIEGRVAFLSNQKDKALELWKRAAFLDKNWAAPLNSIGVIYNERKEYQNARNYLLEAVRREPDWGVPYYNVGTSYFYEKNYDKAEAYYRQAVERAPNWPRPHGWLGEIAMRRRDCDRAVSEFEAVLNLVQPGTTTIDLEEIKKRLALARQKSPELCNVNEVIAQATYSIRLFNCDDRCTAQLNDNTVTEYSAGFGQDSGWLDITAALRAGRNEIKFSVHNDGGGGIAYGFQVRQNETVLYEQICGRAGVVGCDNNRSYPTGVAREFPYTIVK
jgi:serine/threonine protein kinase